MVKIKGYIFDLDDTLYCEHDYVRSGFRAVARKMEEHSNQDRSQLYGALVQEWRQNGRGKVFNAVCDRFDINIEIKELVQVYREHEPTDIFLYDDAVKLLRYLKQNNIPMGIITDGDRHVQWRKIRALKLDRQIPCIVVSDDLGRECWKPSEVPYQKVLDCLGLQPKECVYIGDNPYKDFCTARMIGMHTIRVIRNVGDHMQIRLATEFEADQEIDSLEQIIGTVET
ncbi:HAD family hydrolase [Aneurinibacillus migulanus]|uniref:Hydrolase n=2 Tax=Aneurinibacillus migulanus TaxID=47500 RepID=A0A0D1XJK6_ANEMI|nr:HAD family hydrolase [Aneurinibacillus migulanus]KIV52443.1 hydrolase [Aneurinibacillus migulanus]KON94619.1 hydrolase [Aneurinibacillus migulanus]MED0892669.1 HAD family hydrolase [Aneurinibacillus migulanus]MED1614310.1 HAD family hydrolase [Aneurinibacillus migulanus]